MSSSDHFPSRSLLTSPLDDVPGSHPWLDTYHDPPPTYGSVLHCHWTISNTSTTPQASLVITSSGGIHRSTEFQGRLLPSLIDRHPLLPLSLSPLRLPCPAKPRSTYGFNKT